MPALPSLYPADSAEVSDALACALRYHGKRRVDHAHSIMARITADYLIHHLQRAGFVLMRSDPAASPNTSHMPSSIG
jgi:hypothetical protein